MALVDELQNNVRVFLGPNLEEITSIITPSFIERSKKGESWSRLNPGYKVSYRFTCTLGNPKEEYPDIFEQMVNYYKEQGLRVAMSENITKGFHIDFSWKVEDDK